MMETNSLYNLRVEKFLLDDEEHLGLFLKSKDLLDIILDAELGQKNIVSIPLDTLKTIYNDMAEIVPDEVN